MTTPAAPAAPSSTPIRLLIADDQALVRGALATLLGLEADLEVVAQVSSGREVLGARTKYDKQIKKIERAEPPENDGKSGN